MNFILKQYKFCKPLIQIRLNFLAQEIYGSELRMGWSHWGSWTICSTTCGEGEMLRSRTCIGACLANEHGAHEAKACNLASCEGIKNISVDNLVKSLIPFCIYSHKQQTFSNYF